jgi:photosystem II stability/assembly factor-like uncharacterized protein
VTLRNVPGADAQCGMSDFMRKRHSNTSKNYILNIRLFSKKTITCHYLFPSGGHKRHFLLRAVVTSAFLMVCPMIAHGQWKKLNTGIVKNFYCLMVKDSIVFAGTDSNGVLRSEDNGETWKICNNGLPTVTWVHNLVSNQKRIFLASFDGLYSSKDNGDSWNKIDLGEGEHRIWSLYANGSTVLAGGYPGGVYVSTDSGTTWSEIGFEDTSMNYVQSVAMFGSKIFAGQFMKGLYRAPLNGQSWTKLQVDTMKSPTFLCLLSKGPALYASGQGIYRSTDSGRTWSSLGSSKMSGSWEIELNGKQLFAVGQKSVFYTEENDTNWVESSIDSLRINPGYNSSLLTIAITQKWIYTGGTNVGLWRAPMGFVSVKKPLQKGKCVESLHFSIVRNTSSNMSLILSLSRAQNVELAIFDLSGARVATLLKGIISAGTNKIALNTHLLHSGCYYLRASGETEEKEIKISIVK